MLAILILIYVVYQIHLVTKKDINTEEATYATFADSIQTKGFVVRDETLVEGIYSGVLNYNIKDGARVSKDGVIAEIYNSEYDITAKNQLANVEKELDSLQSLSTAGDTYISNAELVGGQINTAVSSLMLKVKSGDFSSLGNARSDIQKSISRKNIITEVESVDDYAGRISALEAQKSNLQSSMSAAKGTIVSPLSGYFISNVDGYEGSVDFGKVTGLGVNEIKQIVNSPEKTSAGNNTDKYVGKVCGAFNWYILAVLDKNEVAVIEGVDNVDIEIPSISSESIPAEIVSIKKDSSDGSAAIVLECKNMNSDLAGIRNESINIIAREYKGVIVNERAIRFEDIEVTTKGENGEEITETAENIKGVYVKNGSTLKFVQIFTYKTINGYAICKTSLSDEEQELLVTNSTIQLYDQVIVEGNDLYDGKFIE